VQEGMAREFVNRIQNLRKDSGFDVVDKIGILVEQGSSDWMESIQVFGAYIQQEVQAVKIDILPALTGEKSELMMDDATLFVQIKVIN
jgi:isoleucyl-tRNA synthetase